VGGITAMLAQADVCPSCGKPIREHRAGFPFRAARSCPEVVMGTFPVLTDFASGEAFSADSVPSSRGLFDPTRGLSAASEWPASRSDLRKTEPNAWRVPLAAPEDGD
jgi:hypothetical protein